MTVLVIVVEATGGVAVVMALYARCCWQVQCVGHPRWAV